VNSDERSGLRRPGKGGRPWAVRRLVPAADRVLDRIRLALDLAGGPDYQPVPWIGRQSAPRASGTVSRWAAIREQVRECQVGTAVDLGCNTGYFVVRLSQEGIRVVGIDSSSRHLRTLKYVTRRAGLKQLGIMDLRITPETIALIPAADAILCLAMWHHMVKRWGVPAAEEMLRVIWKRAGRVLFFEAGGAEMPSEEYSLGMEGDSRSYYEEVLGRCCIGGRIVHLGLHQAVSPSGEECRRDLFAIRRAWPHYA
jgi:hypothetical protein